MSKYQFYILDKNGNFLADLSGIAQDREVILTRNGSYSAQFKVDANVIESLARQLHVSARSIFNIAQSQLLVQRQNIPFYSGQLSYFDVDFKSTMDFTVKTTGWLDVLKDRFTTIEDVHTAEDQSQILWDLINYTQGITYGSLGITRGSYQTSIARERTYENKNIRDAIVEMTNLTDGVDVEFTWDRKFNTFYPLMGVVHNDFTLIYPHNIKEFKVITDATKMMNWNIARGSGTGDGQLIDIVEDTTSEAEYGVKQAVSDYSDVLDIDTLDQYAQADLDSMAQPIDTLEITLDGNKPPFFGSYWLGDFVQIQIYNSDLFSYITGYYRINQIDLKIDNDDNEDVILKLNQEPKTFAKTITH